MVFAYIMYPGTRFGTSRDKPHLASSRGLSRLAPYKASRDVPRLVVMSPDWSAIDYGSWCW